MTNRVKWEPGLVVDGYTVHEKLGQGGMGAVYRVEQNATGGHYALKTVSAPNPELVLRFQREAEMQARVDGHPNVVRIHSAANAHGRVYCVMDLAAGGDLDARLAQGPLPPREAVRLARDLALGLSHVHANGILHRDLKPQNVLFDEHGTPKLVDFGLAKLIGAESLTQTGEILGTPAYMAPEQAEGQRHAIDERSDVYGLGGILYTALTCEPPFQGRTHLELLGKVLGQAPTPPSKFVDLPPGLEAIVLRCLEKRPEDRYASAAALAEALSGWLEGKVTPPPPILAAAGLLVAGLVAALIVLAQGSRPLPPVAESRETPSPSEGVTPDQPPEPAPSPTPSPRSLEELFLALLESIGEPAPDPPWDLPLRLANRWRSPITPVGLGQSLHAEGYDRYARPWFLRGANKDPMGWVELGLTFYDPKRPELDQDTAERCFQLGIDGKVARAARLLGDLRHLGYGKPEQPVPSHAEQAAKLYALGLTLQDYGTQDRVTCAERLGDIALRVPGVYPRSEAISNFEEFLPWLPHASTMLVLAKLIIGEDLEDRTELVDRLLFDAALKSPQGLGHDAVITRAHLLRRGWGSFPRDLAAAAKLLRGRLHASRALPEPTGAAVASAMRLRYELAMALTVYAAPEVPREEPLAVSLWREVLTLDKDHPGWLSWASLRRIMDLAESEDPTIRAEAKFARADLEAAARAGNKGAQDRLERGFGH